MDVFSDNRTGWAAGSDWQKRVEEKASRLSALQAPLEVMFLDIGRQLHDLAGSLRTLDSQAVTLSNLIDSPGFHQTLRGIEEAMKTVGESGELAGRNNGTRLQSLISSVRDGTRTLGDVAAIMGYVRILGVNATIESAHLGESALGLQAFTRGILSLSEKGRETLDRALTVLESLEQAATDAIGQWRDFESAHERQTNEIKQYFGVSLGLVHERKKAIAEAMGSLRSLLDEGSVLTGRLVADLQFGDILRQRIEHVVEGLETPLSRAADMQAQESEDGLIAYAAMCDLQAIHMDDIIKDYEEKAGEALRSLDALADIVARILTVLSSVYRHAFSHGESFLSAITDDLGTVNEIAASRAAMLERTRTQLRDVVKGTTRVATDIADIREIDIDMNVLGLNAAIICGNRGWDGRTLTVLAHELRACAANSRQLTDKASSEIDGIIAHAGALGDSGSGSGDSGDSSDGAEPGSDAILTDSLENWIGTLNAIDKNISQTLRLIEDVGADAMQGAKAVVGRFRDNEDLQKNMRAIADGLRQETARMAPHLTSDDFIRLRSTSFSFMEARYTMESERQIHKGDVSHDAEPVISQAEMDDEAFLDDVLF